MKIVGITGPSGSGKSLLSERLRLSGIPTVDADKLYHSMLIPPSRCLDAIAKAFGSDVLTKDGGLDRKVLSAKVFSDKNELARLNATVLPIVLDEIREIIKQNQESGACIMAVDAPTLIESGFNAECDLTVSVLASRDTRISRISVRDGITEEKAKERVNAQHSDDFYTSASDIVITNDKDIESFDIEAQALINKLLSL